MTGAFFYKPGPAGTGWELQANPEVEASLLPLCKTVLVSDNFPAGRTTIGHIARNGDYVVVVYKDRRFAGQLIATAAYEARGFDPFVVVAELPAADAALRAAVAWGDALAVATAPIARTPPLNTVLWQAPTDTLAIALARALFLAGVPRQRRATFFSLSLRDLPFQRSVLTRLTDQAGQPPPAALLAAARALPEAAAEALNVTLALPSAGPSMQHEQADAWEVWSSVRKSAPPSPSPAPSAPPPRQDTSTAATKPVAQEGMMPRPTDTFPPTSEMPSPVRARHPSTAPWWLSPAATAAVALLLVAWIGKETALLRGVRNDTKTAAEAANTARIEANRLAAEAAAATIAVAKDAAAANAARAEATRLAAEAAAATDAVAKDAAAANAAKAEATRLAAEAANSAAAAAQAADSAAAAADSAKRRRDRP
ncbi:hypothetical protein FHT77_005857 [Rhizobium sp. BK181]|uniref:hypothetical protein n=1 Tax=Rhizobium sp. BK181 TaxID=2587072 RepID=UPI00160C2EAA|nr:hypothetical protein [Rhizobium sp. BK181]MBB3319939.1 hypothetical protein [Rhizobium sp. BK181]